MTVPAEGAALKIKSLGTDARYLGKSIEKVSLLVVKAN
jgi:hypothetical protein